MLLGCFCYNSCMFFLRAKEKWMEVIKENILNQIGRKNTTIPQGTLESKLDFDHIQNFLNTTGGPVGEDQITEKIRGFYPSCKYNI